MQVDKKKEKNTCDPLTPVELHSTPESCMPVELQWSGQYAGHPQNSFLNGPVDCLGGFLNVRCPLS
jgi:hypothetical protein